MTTLKSLGPFNDMEESLCVVPTCRWTSVFVPREHPWP